MKKLLSKLQKIDELKTTITKKITLEIDAASATAKDAVEKAGGTIKLI